METNLANNSDAWARALGLGSFALAALALYLNRRDRRPRVWVYAHYAPGNVGTLFPGYQWAVASGAPDEELGVHPRPQPAFRNLWLMVSCDRETDLSQAWFQFGDRREPPQSQFPLPSRLLPHRPWVGWIPWDRVPEEFLERAPRCGRAILTVTRDRVHESRPTPRNLLLGGSVPGPEA